MKSKSNCIFASFRRTTIVLTLSFTKVRFRWSVKQEAVSKKILKFCDAIKNFVAFILNGWSTKLQVSERLTDECHWALALVNELIQVLFNTVVTCVSKKVDRFTFFVPEEFCLHNDFFVYFVEGFFICIGFG